MLQSVPPTAPSVRRRRRSETAPLERRAFTLHADVVEAVKEAVQQGVAQNQSAFVESAIREKLERTKRTRLYDAYAAAAADPAFVEEMMRDVVAFDGTVSDGLTSPQTSA